MDFDVGKVSQTCNHIVLELKDFLTKSRLPAQCRNDNSRRESRSEIPKSSRVQTSYSNPCLQLNYNDRRAICFGISLWKCLTIDFLNSPPIFHLTCFAKSPSVEKEAAKQVLLHKNEPFNLSSIERTDKNNYYHRTLQTRRSSLTLNSLLIPPLILDIFTDNSDGLLSCQFDDSPRAHDPLDNNSVFADIIIRFSCSDEITIKIS